MGRFLSGIRTLRVRILAIVALCWLLPTVVLGVYMSSVFLSALRARTEQALVAGAAHAQELTQQQIDRILKKSRDVTYDGVITEYAADYAAGKVSYREFFINSRTYWYRMFQRERTMGITAFTLIDEPGMVVHTTEDASALLYFQENVLPGVLALADTLDTRSRFASIDGELVHVRNLLNLRLEWFGVMMLQLDPELLFQALLDENTLWSGRVDIQLDDFVWLSDPEGSFSAFTVDEGISQADGMLYYGKRLKTSDYMLSYRIYLDESVILGQANEYYQLIVSLLLLLVPVEALIMLFIHRKLTQPLVALSRATVRLAGGELGITVPTDGMDEIGRVGMAFNAMSTQMQRLIDKSYREELALRDARISALQSRINPHFMNNALELMNWQARLDGADTVSQMIEALSTLINATLDRTNERTVPLRVEIEVADAYFFFIAQRYGDRVRIDKQIDSELMGRMVPRLIVQTLLENAVEHGISPAGGGVVRLHVYERGGELVIDVWNDGRTLSEQDEATICASLSGQGRDDMSRHLGIRNVNLRLKLIYGESAGLSLRRDPKSGETIASIHIPAGNPDNKTQQTTHESNDAEL